MPGVFNLSVDEAVKEAEAGAALGIGGLLLFGLPEKDEQATGAWANDGIVQQGLRALKSRPQAGPDRRCVPVRVHLARPLRHRPEDGDDYHIENDASLELLAKTAVSLAAAGADIVAPSDMMDGRVEAIRGALDEYELAERRS